nr:hypothetical protein [Candidatus Hakubella thermalkaliphila]
MRQKARSSEILKRDAVFLFNWTNLYRVSPGDPGVMPLALAEMGLNISSSQCIRWDEDLLEELAGLNPEELLASRLPHF